MSGTQPLPRFHIDQPDTIPNGVRADLGRVFDRRTRKVGTAGWDGQHRLVVFTPDQLQPHLSFLSTVSPVIAEPVTLDVGLGRFIALDDPRLYPLVGVAIQGNRLDAIVRARVVFDLGLAEAKSLIEAVLVERSERGPITGVTLKDGRTVVVRKQDDDEAKEREGWSFTSGLPDSGGDDTLALDLREKGIEIRTMRAIDDLRARDMGNTFRNIVVLGLERPDAHGTVYTPEVAEQIARQIASAQVTHASVGPVRTEGGHLTGVSLGYTVKRNLDRGHARQRRAEEFGDAFDALEQVLFNLGLGEDYQRVLLANLDKHQPEILSAVLTVRELVTRAQDRADRLQAVIDAETGRKGLEGWVYSYVFRDMVDNAAWRLDLSDGRCVVAWGRRMDGSDKCEESNPGGWAIWMLNADGELDEEYGVGGNDPVWNALDAMEHATRRLHELGLLAQATPSP